MIKKKPLMLLVVILCLAITSQHALAYDEVNKTYYPVLTPPSHIYRVQTYNDDADNSIKNMTTMIGDVSAATTFDFGIYIVSSDEPTTDTDLKFLFYKDPYYSGYSEYVFDMSGYAENTWHHISIPISSLPLYAGMDWSEGGILQIRGVSGGFDIWLDNVGFYDTLVPVRVMVDGDNDTWGGTAVTQAQPPVANNGNASNLVYIAYSNAFSNVYNGNKYNKQMMLLESLQGLLLRNKSSNGIHVETGNSYSSNFDQINLRRTVMSEYVAGPKDIWWLVNHLSSEFSGQYVLFDIDANPQSHPAAKMAAYLYNAVMVDKPLQAEAIANGLTLALDVSSYDNQWIYNNWLPTWQVKDVAVDSFNEGGYMGMLNEYAVATGTLCFREDFGTQLRMDFLDAMDIDSPVLGWPIEAYGELPSTLDNSLHDTHWTAINSVHNTAFYSSFREPNLYPLQQNTHSQIDTNDNTHYVCFVWSDGDNSGWHNAGYCWNTNWWASPDRGQVSVGWPLSLTMRDLGQTNIEYRYDTAANNPDAKDFFIAVGAPGYSYPAYYSESARQINSNRTEKYMADLDLNILMVLDKFAFETPEVYLPYMEKNQVDAMFYWDVWGNYARYHGDIKWVNGKPIISQYTMLHGYNISDVAAEINARLTDPYSESGYSMIGVGAWGTTVSDIAACADLFDADVKVVTPDEFVKLIRQNLSPPLLNSAYEIDTGDLQLGAYETPSDPSYTITTNSTQQQIDGTPSTKFQIGSTYAFSNMSFSPIDISDSHSFDIDIYGDANGTTIRLGLYSSAFGFIYKDMAIDFSGWRSFSWNLDGTEGGMLEHPAGTRANTLSSVDIFQLSGPWNATPGVFYIDNAVVTVQSPYDLNNDGAIDFLDVAEFCSQWLSANPSADFDDSGKVDFIDWADFAHNWLISY